MNVVRAAPLVVRAAAVLPMAVIVDWALILGYATAKALATIGPLADTSVFKAVILPLEAVTEKATVTPVEPCNKRRPALAATLVMTTEVTGKPRNVAKEATNCVLKLVDCPSATEIPVNVWVYVCVVDALNALGHPPGAR